MMAFELQPRICAGTVICDCFVGEALYCLGRGTTPVYSVWSMLWPQCLSLSLPLVAGGTFHRS
jgi:hypothetical protein